MICDSPIFVAWQSMLKQPATMGSGDEANLSAMHKELVEAKAKEQGDYDDALRQVMAIKSAQDRLQGKYPSVFEVGACVQGRDTLISKKETRKKEMKGTEAKGTRYRKKREGTHTPDMLCPDCHGLSVIDS